MPQIKLFTGDSLQKLKNFPENSFDSIISDPPYGLSKEPDPVEVMTDWVNKGYHEIKSKAGGFMGREWDSFVPQPVLWREVFRTLKPGAHGLVACGTRTVDWMMMALRFAGFEVRDIITWHYGSGFPKSLDVGKAIDKEAGAIRDICIGSRGLHSYKTKDTGNAVGLRGDFAEADKKFAPATDDAKQWDGWGTALKPATEMWVLIRKPLAEGTVAANVLKYGTGGLNIAGSKIPFKSDEDLKKATWGTGTNIIGGNYVGSVISDGRKNIEADKNGRWPANVVFDEFTSGLLDEQTGVLKSGERKSTHDIGNEDGENYNHGIYGKAKAKPYTDVPASEGGASRFFYCAKASKSDRNEGLYQPIEYKLKSEAPPEIVDKIKQLLNL